MVTTLGEMYPILKSCEGLPAERVLEAVLRAMPQGGVQRTEDEDVPLHIMLALAIQDLRRNARITHRVPGTDSQIVEWARDLRVYMQMEELRRVVERGVHKKKRLDSDSPNADTVDIALSRNPQEGIYLDPAHAELIGMRGMPYLSSRGAILGGPTFTSLLVR